MKRWGGGTTRLRSGVYALLYLAFFAPILTIQWRWLGPVPSLPRLVMLAAGTTIVLFLERRSWVSIGVSFAKESFRELLLGGLIGIVTAIVVTIAMAALGCRWHLGSTLSAGEHLLIFLSVATFEELAFRGYLFARLREAFGTWPTLIGSAIFFAGMHGLRGPISETALPALALGIGAMVLGYTVATTNRISMAIGLHWLWNGALGGVFGFNILGHSAPGVLSPEFASSPWITSGDLGPGSGIPGIVAFAIVFVLFLRYMRLPQRA